MYYIPYMLLKNQLLDHSKAKLIVEGIEVYFEVDQETQKWTIKANIPFYVEEMSGAFIETIESLYYVKIHKARAFLKVFLEEGVVAFSSEVSEITSFICFKESMKVFMELFDFWRSVVEDIVKNEEIYIS